MIKNLKEKIYQFLRWSEKYTKTDMVYLAHGGFWLTLTQIISSISIFVLAVVFANLLPKEVYGTYKYILSTIGLLFIFSLSGMNIALIPEIAQGKENLLKTARKTKFHYALIGSLVSIGVASYYFYKDNYIFSLIYIITALLFPFWESGTIYDAYLSGKTDFKRLTIYSSLQTIIISAALIVASLIWRDFLPLLLVYIVLQTFITNFYYHRVSNQIKKETENIKDPHLENYAKHLSINNILNFISDKIDSVILFQILGPSQLAIYSFAIAIPEQIKSIIKNISTVSMPKFAQRPIKEIRKNIWRKLFFLFLGITMVVLIYIFMAPIIYKIFFPNYLESVKFSQIYSLSLLATFTIPILSIFQSHKKIKEIYITNNIGSILLIAFLFLGTYFYGLTGAIISWIFYRAIYALILIRYMKNI